MKTKMIFCLVLVLSGGLFDCSNVGYAQDKPDWSPIKTTIDVGGTVAVPPKYRQKLNLPERISFDIKIDSVAERIANTERSKASIHYLVMLKSIGTNLVYLDMTNTVSGEANGIPQEAVKRITASAVDTVTAALDKFIGHDGGKSSLTNTIAFSNLSTNTSAASTNDIVIKKLKLERNGKKDLDYPSTP
ncbi:MAG: hypothetical protein ACREDS_06565 [Limisphaerales bacterium]